MATPKQTLKQYFENGKKPTEQEFCEFIDAFLHVDDQSLLSKADANEATQGQDDRKYMTPLMSKKLVDKEITDFYNTLMETDDVDNVINTLGEVLESFKNMPEGQQRLLDFMNDFNAHVSHNNNPHNVTKHQVGLGNIPNSTENAHYVDNTNTLATAKAVRNLFDQRTDSLTTDDSDKLASAKAVHDLNHNIFKQGYKDINPHDAAKWIDTYEFGSQENALIQITLKQFNLGGGSAVRIQIILLSATSYYSTNGNNSLSILDNQSNYNGYIVDKFRIITERGWKGGQKLQLLTRSDCDKVQVTVKVYRGGNAIDPKEETTATTSSTHYIHQYDIPTSGVYFSNSSQLTNLKAELTDVENNNGRIFLIGKVDSAGGINAWVKNNDVVSFQRYYSVSSGYWYELSLHDNYSKSKKVFVSNFSSRVYTSEISYDDSDQKIVVKIFHTGSTSLNSEFDILILN